MIWFIIFATLLLTALTGCKSSADDPSVVPPVTVLPIPAVNLTLPSDY